MKILQILTLTSRRDFTPLSWTSMRFTGVIKSLLSQDFVDSFKVLSERHGDLERTSLFVNDEEC